MKKWLLFMALMIPMFVHAESVQWNPPNTWQNGQPMSDADKAKMTYYLRIWRPSTPSSVFYLGETRNGTTVWVDNILTRANERVTPPLVPGDNVIVGVSSAFKLDNGAELDSYPTLPMLSKAWTIPKPLPDSYSGCNPPTNLTITEK